jgi:hypothetical protein
MSEGSRSLQKAPCPGLSPLCLNNVLFRFRLVPQTPNDIKFIRSVLADGGKPNIQIIAKIESLVGKAYIPLRSGIQLRA